MLALAIIIIFVFLLSVLFWPRKKEAPALPLGNPVPTVLPTPDNSPWKE